MLYLEAELVALHLDANCINVQPLKSDLIDHCLAEYLNGS